MGEAVELRDMPEVEEEDAIARASMNDPISWLEALAQVEEEPNSVSAAAAGDARFGLAKNGEDDDEDLFSRPLLFSTPNEPRLPLLLFEESNCDSRSSEILDKSLAGN